MGSAVKASEAPTARRAHARCALQSLAMLAPSSAYVASALLAVGASEAFTAEPINKQTAGNSSPLTVQSRRTIQPSHTYYCRTAYYASPERTPVDELVVSTEVYADPEEVYEFLLDFPGYARYSKYLDDVETIQGDGGPGTRYALHFAWWKITYTAHSRVTGVEPPERIDWEITKDIDAGGCWRVTPATSETDSGGSSVCEVALEVEFDPGSASPDALDLPRLVSFDWVVKKAVPLIRSEAERVVQRAVRDLEGSTRDVDLDVYVDSERI
jgi:hypothetical protein